MKAILDEIARFTPDTGFNVVAIDEYELPGERLTLVAHYATRAEADAAVAGLTSEHPGGDYRVYGPAATTSDPEGDEMARRDRIALGLPPREGEVQAFLDDFAKKTKVALDDYAEELEKAPKIYGPTGVIDDVDPMKGDDHLG